MPNSLTLAEFKAGFPELESAGDSLILAKLGEAHRSIRPEEFGDQYPDAVGYTAAILIATSPYGANTRLADEATTTYQKALERIVQTIPAGPLVIQHRRF